jgi:hypothetical protein
MAIAYFFPTEVEYSDRLEGRAALIEVPMLALDSACRRRAWAVLRT